MDVSEEKFFEELARFGSGGKDPGSETEAELAKASAGALRESKTRYEDELEIEPEGQLTIDVYQTPDEIVIESAVAGVKPEDLDISVTNDSITIRGERRRENKIKDDDYLYQECYWGRFSRSVILPQEVDADEAEVKFKNGILTVRLPKLNRQKTKKLKVKSE